jgi:sRNA-binding carbon storage regulator CsrA
MSNKIDSELKKGAIIARYPGQRILIGDSVVVRIVKIEGSKVYVQVETTNGMMINRPNKEEDSNDKKMSDARKSTSLTSQSK